MSEWRQKIAALVSDYSKIHVYAVDPGAVASLQPFYEEAQKLGIAGDWFAEGWAADHAESHYKTMAQMEATLGYAVGREAVLMGQQVNFEQAYARLKFFREQHYQTIFISDHWKDIATLFRPHATEQPLLPHRFLVPDQEAYELQRSTLPTIGLTEQQIDSCIEVFLHTGVARSLDKIDQITDAHVDKLRKRYGISGRSVIMLLDNVDRKGTALLGFGWQNCLDLAIAYKDEYEPGTKFLVKPHPRQDMREIEAYIRNMPPRTDIEIVTEMEGEPFIKLCDEVWGMTTVLLVIARHAGKPIRAFMAERTGMGALDSNAHIEPYAILGWGDFAASRQHYPEQQNQTPVRHNRYSIR
ncbi:MAG: hypothetical protein HYS17_00585 [Micavibrio aeruginosavorus]|uniref:Uncharacterized protein n=1 Tax=Micavibrio aeruginosavorus TaxID=349221 RepID=A0A7T5R2F2_9BACT|nr:MAG: hypothetical protein HYS17_00585 [Micavibrio aeruginosavorus]